MSSLIGSMASSINKAVRDETFLPGQIFVFGGFALAWPSGADRELRPWPPGQFGNLNYTADIRGDLIFDGFEPMPGVPNGHDGHDLNLPSDSIREIAPAAAPGINSE